MLTSTRTTPAANSAAASPKTGASVEKRPRGKVRRAANGALLAAGLAIAQTDDYENETKWRLFDPGLLDRLTAPLTRYRE